MSNEVKRYDHESYEYEPGSYMEERANGDYVLHSDYEKLKAQLEEVEKIHEPVGRDTKNGFIELRQLVNIRYGLLIAPCGFKHECHFITAEDADWVLEQKKIAYEKLKAQLEKAESVLNKIQWLGHPERATFKQCESMEIYRCSTCDSAERAREYFKEKESK